jgi:hypothetical protein
MSFHAEVETQKYVQAMKLFDKHALPRTVADTLNGVAEAVSKQAKINVQKRLIVRTKFTTNSIRQDRHARGTNIEKMYSRAGSISPYLRIQDQGGIVQADDQRLPIPTLEARTGRSNTRAVARRYRMNQLGALKRNKKYFIGRPNGAPLGIYERKKKRKLKMIRSLEKERITVPASRFFSDSVKKYGTSQFIRAQFIKRARKHLSEYME